MKTKGKYFLLAVMAMVLLGAHVLLSLRYRDTMYYQKTHPVSNFYVFSETGYDLLSFGMKDEASRLFLLYAIYTPVNINIPRTDFQRLHASLDGISHIDPKNIQPYLMTAYYWSWSKRPEHKQIMVPYMQQGAADFPENWDIPYSVYRFMRESVPEGEERDAEAARIAMDYLQEAATRAVTYGGPKWIVDYPAVMMEKDGESLEAAFWLLETLQKTDNPDQIKVIEERFVEIVSQLPAEQAKMLEDQLRAVMENRG